MKAENGGGGGGFVLLPTKAIKKIALALLAVFGLVSLVQSIKFLNRQGSLHLSSKKKDDKITRYTKYEQVQVPVSVLVIPHMERGLMSNPVVKHLYEDGLDQSTLLVKSTSNLDSNLVWVFDPQAAAAAARPLSRSSQNDETPLWCTKLVQKVIQAQGERNQQGLGTIWPIHFVDNKDGSNIFRCQPLEEHVGIEHVYYHQRGVVVERMFDLRTQWVWLGKLLTPPDKIQFYHKPIGVRTDIVQAIQDNLQGRGGSFSISNAIEKMPRDIDLSYFWDPDTTNNGKPLAYIKLRNVVYRVLKDMQQEHAEYTFALGLTGDRGERGRRGVSPSYIQGLLESKIVVVAQRDEYEDHYRLMEALVAGPLVMTDKMLSLPRGLKDGVSIVEYTSASDLSSKVEYYLHHEQERIEIAGRGREVAMSRYRSWHQLEEIVLGHPVSRCSGQECMTAKISTSLQHPVEAMEQSKAKETGTEYDPKTSVGFNSEEKNQAYILNSTHLQKGKTHFLICGGRGTTATRTVFKATCLLGIPSIHWKLQCTSPSAFTSNRFRKGPTTKLTRDKPSIQAGIDAHQKLTVAFMTMPFCLNGTIPCPDVGVWRMQIMELVDAVVGSGVASVHDTPYPSVMSYLFKSVQKFQVKPVIVLSERDPNDWTRSRSMLNKKMSGMDPICKERFTGDGGPFDVFACMDRAMQRMGESENYSLLNFLDIFTTLRTLADNGKSDHIVFAMKEYQDWLRPQANFTIDLFQKNAEPVTTEGLASDLSDAVPIEDFGLKGRKTLRISNLQDERQPWSNSHFD